jgi:hypothetical protein
MWQLHQHIVTTATPRKHTRHSQDQAADNKQRRTCALIAFIFLFRNGLACGRHGVMISPDELTAQPVANLLVSLAFSAASS